MKKFIQVFKPSYGPEELETLKDIFATGWVGLGPKTQEFEERFADYIGVKYAVAVSSGTAALETALYAVGVGEGDEVILPSFTIIFCALPWFGLGLFLYLLMSILGHGVSMARAWRWLLRRKLGR